MTKPPTRILLQTKDLEAKYGIPEATWRYWRAAKTGPPAIVLGKRKVVYDAAVVDAWIDSRAEQAGA